MAPEPAHGPGRDEDPARHAPETGAWEPLPPPPGPAGEAHASVTKPADDAPLPAASVPSGEVRLPAASTPALDMPVPGASPDWLDDGGWAAIVAAGPDEE